ncbi:growth arrest-specific protein 1b [Brachyhypopomus gauderio]|uniref:growth arrest-specific protein 1b n=1 Tax=Brachyhypopomus gauderio TaxID=698409 RepID=UPI0040420478
MATCAFVRVTQRPRVLIWTIAFMVVCLGCSAVASPAHGNPLICWQAIMKCQGEPQCHYAYTQYMHACGPVINGHKKRCPSHCISSIIQLNLTDNGPGLENCECASDPLCKSTKRAIEPCLPKIRHTGCTEARRDCEKDPECGTAMRDYLYHCRKLFGGERCSDDCRRVITRMRSVPKAQLLDTCVCDGTERTICEYVKVSMRNLCFNSPDGYAGSGFSDDEDDPENDYEMEDYVEESKAGGASGPRGAVTVTSTILALAFLL